MGPGSCLEQDLDTSATCARRGDADYFRLVESVFSHSTWACIDPDQLTTISWIARETQVQNGGPAYLARTPVSLLEDVLTSEVGVSLTSGAAAH